MRGVEFAPNFPCLDYALQRIGCPEQIDTLDVFLNHHDFQKFLWLNNRQLRAGDIICWVDTVKVREYATNISQEGEVSHANVLASFHCAVIEDDSTISHLILNGGTMYTLYVEDLSAYLKRGTRANFPALVFRWEGDNG